MNATSCSCPDMSNAELEIDMQQEIWEILFEQGQTDFLQSHEALLSAKAFESMQ